MQCSKWFILKYTLITVSNARRDTAGHKRAAIMLKFADLLEQNIDKLAKLESAAMGQPVSVAKKMSMS